MAEKAASAESAKELLTAIKPYTSPDFHASLLEALAAAEAETGAPVTMDGASQGYKAFAAKVKVCIGGSVKVADGAVPSVSHYLMMVCDRV